jgi:hypothetical protein
MKVFILFGLLYIVNATAIAQHNHAQTPVTDKPSIHGMLIFGKEQVYASHLPMFHSPHNYQIIIKLQLSPQQKKKFVTDQQQHPEMTTYTIEPERFVLPDMMKKQKKFKANLYRGHFERGGVKIADSITFTIADVVYLEKFDAVKNDTARNEYIFFGNAKEKFLAHRITRPVDFDQVIQVQQDTHWLVEDRNVVYGRILSIPGNDGRSPLGVSGNSIQTLIGEKPLEMVLLKQLYLEFDDLKQ